ncbi:hypothetical protein Tco_1500129 [Tanacetum coccineum]
MFSTNTERFPSSITLIIYQVPVLMKTEKINEFGQTTLTRDQKLSVPMQKISDNKRKDGLIHPETTMDTRQQPFKKQISQVYNMGTGEKKKPYGETYPTYPPRKRRTFQKENKLRTYQSSETFLKCFRGLAGSSLVPRPVEFQNRHNPGAAPLASSTVSD